MARNTATSRTEPAMVLKRTIWQLSSEMYDATMPLVPNITNAAR